MKKFVVTLVFISTAFLLFAQNSPQTSDVDILKKQTSALATSSMRHDAQLKTLIKTSKAIQDSLQAQIGSNSNELKMLSDSLFAKASEISQLKEKMEKNQHRFLATTNVIYVLLAIVVILIALVYFLFVQKVRKNQAGIQELSEKLPNEIAKLKKDSDFEISILKRDLEDKIKEVAK
jgi:hypothetical protein